MPSKFLGNAVGRFAQGATSGVPGVVAEGAKTGASFLERLLGKRKEGKQARKEKRSNKQAEWVKKFRFLKEKRGIPETKIKNSDIAAVDTASDEYKSWMSGTKSKLPNPLNGKN